MNLRTIAALVFVLLAVLGVGNDASAHDIAYPPLAEACDRYPGETWDVPADEVVEAYLGCFVDESVDATGDINCPGGTVAKGNYCVPAVDHHVDNGGDCPGTWVEIVGGIVDVACLNPSGYENGIVYDAPLGVCYSGLYLAHIGMTNYLECVGPDYGAEYPEEEPKDSDDYESGADTGSTDEGYAYIGENYVNADGVRCRSWPVDGPVALVLNQGDQVSEYADGAPDGWQMVRYQGGAPCYILAELLGDSPATSEVVVEPIEDDAGVEVTQGPVNGPSDSNEVGSVTSLPNTGHGPQHEHLQHDEAEPTITPEQRKWGLVVTAILFIGLLVAQPWKSPQGR